MYPDPTASHNYYATLAEPANPIDRADDDPSEEQQQTHTPVLIHPFTTPQSRMRPSKKVNWAATLTPNQDKPKHIPTLSNEHCNNI